MLSIFGADVVLTLCSSEKISTTCADTLGFVPMVLMLVLTLMACSRMSALKCGCQHSQSDVSTRVRIHSLASADPFEAGADVAQLRCQMKRVLTGCSLLLLVGAEIRMLGP